MAQKIQIALFAGLLFYVLSNPVTYTVLDSVAGFKLAVNGKPTGLGLLLHSLAFAGITYALMCM